jgi:hypothetical protein
MARFVPKSEPLEYGGEIPVAIPAPIGERGMVVIKLAVPPWSDEVMTIFRDGLQDWLNKAHRGELKQGDQFVLQVP